MRYLKHTILILLLYCACSEPFEFDIEEGAFNVVDAKVSTEEGSSYVRIYALNDSIQTVRPDFVVQVLSDEGEIIDFAFDQSSGNYLPIDPTFRGEIGAKYRFSASNNDGILFESSYDSIPDSLPISINIADTTVLEFNERLNRFLLSDAVNSTAIVPFTSEIFYSRINLVYAYQDFWKSDSTILEELDDFILLDNFQIPIPASGTTIPLGIRVNELWLFFDTTQPASFCTSVVLFNCPDPCCGNPCCEYLERWVMEFRLEQENISPATYDYWKNVEKLRDNDGLVFDTFPFPVEGNIECTGCENQTLGLFQAVSKSVSSIQKELRVVAE